MTDEKNEADPSGAYGGSLANRRRAMSKYDEWLAAKGIARRRGTAMDEILWLREERNRLRLTDAEREVLLGLACHCDTRSGGEWHRLSAVVRGLLSRLS